MASEAVQPAKAAKSEARLRIALVAGSMLFAWILVELPAALNILDYQALQLTGAWSSVRFIRIPDPELLYREPPHARHKGSSLGGDFPAMYDVPPSEQTRYEWDLTYDRNGFRNDTDLTSAGMAVIGDSLVEGMTVPHDQLITTLLERAENQPVANFGQYGYGPWQELVVLKRYALPLRPRTIVWVFSEATDLEDYGGYRRAIAHPQTAWDRFAQRSFTRVIYRAGSRLFAPSKPKGITRSGVFHRADGSAMNVYFSFKPHSLTADDWKAAKGTGRIVAEAQRIAAAQGARFLFVFAPDKFRVYHAACQFPSQSECARWSVNDLPERLRSDLQSAAPGAEYLDLTPVLAAAANRGVVPYYPDDVHWTPEGHRIVADEIERFLAANAGR